MVNIGPAGLALETAQMLAVGRSYDFRIRLGSKHLRLPGRIRWCRLIGTVVDDDGDAPPVFQAGVALAEAVSCRAWREALRRLTRAPTYVIWHRARSQAPQMPSGPLPPEP